MVEWAIVNTSKINRIGYNKKKESMFIDFVGSETDTVFLKVPEALYSTFIQAKSSDQFYIQFVDGYFDVAVEGSFDVKKYPAVTLLDNYRKKIELLNKLV